MLQFKDHSLFRRKLFQRRLNPAAHFPPGQHAVRIAVGPLILGIREEVVSCPFLVHSDGPFLADTLSPQLIQANISPDAIQPSPETALKPELPEAAVGPQEHLLVSIAGIVRGAQDVESHAEHGTVMQPHELLESVSITPLGRLDKCRLTTVSRTGVARQTNCLHLRRLQIA